jgi:carboxymethylenebutenolidase
VARRHAVDDESGVRAEWIRLDGPGDFGYLAEPAGARAVRPLLVIHEGWGLNDDGRALCRDFARAGFLTLAPDLYRRGPDRVAGYDEYDKAVAMLTSLPDAQVLEDLGLGLDWLARRAGVGAAGVVGYRIGGRYALLLAVRHPERVGCVVSYYGAGIDAGTVSPLWTLDALSESAGITAPLLLIFAGDDRTVPEAEVARIEIRLAELGKRAEIIRYPGVRPGFPFPGRETHEPHAARAAWDKTIALLEATIAARGIRASGGDGRDTGRESPAT